MKRKEITEETCEISVITSVSVEGGNPVVFLFSDYFGNQTELTMDEIGANALRIAIGSLKNLPPLFLPKSPEGEFQCIYPRVHYTRIKDGIEFEKELGDAKPLGRYDTIDDGIILYTETGTSVMCFNCEDSALEKERLVLFLSDDILETMKMQLDKIFPFNRFGKKNRLSYGYFKTPTTEGGR